MNLEPETCMISLIRQITDDTIYLKKTDHIDGCIRTRIEVELTTYWYQTLTLLHLKFLCASNLETSRGKITKTGLSML